MDDSMIPNMCTYVDEESCHRLTKTSPILCIKHMLKERHEADFLVLLRVSEANDVPISSHIWVALTTFKQLENL